ncbi:MAG: hypothetical protein QNJ36_00425 [Calothrix sp. MO_167.B42]|nr:hypothetical protein [Calothrix sp. MO_167.B42]
MSKPNFDTMSKAELRAYVIAHQDDQEAFYVLVDSLTANQSAAKYLAPMTPQDIQKAVLEQIQKRNGEGIRRTLRNNINEASLEIGKSEVNLKDT